MKTAVRVRDGPLLLTFKYQFYGIIAVIVLLICVSRIGSKDLREVAVEIVLSILTVGAAISLPLSIMNNIKVVIMYLKRHYNLLIRSVIIYCIMML